MNRQRIRRYPGLHYFTTEQKAQFFGREEEEAALLALALTEKIVALFGKSGYGKSSLLRAGLIPRLPPDWLPIVVQLGAYQSGQSPTPLARTRAQLDAVLPEDTPETAFLEQISADTLWRRFRRKQDPEKRTVLLLFDQFEEFQTYPADQREEFKKQLAELLYTRIPQAVRDAADDLPDAQQAILARPNEVKALFALREDRLSVLDGLADKLPAILHKRYHLKGLDDAHAQEAILQPAALPQGDRYESPPFRYTAGALSAIKRGLKKDEQDTTIESFLLQICCEEIERGVIERAGAGAGDIEVAERDLPVFEELFEQYYRNKIAALPDDTQRAAARRMMEDHLVKTDPGSGIAYRISADGRALRALPGVDEALLKRLTDVFLLRSEPNTTGDFSYEVSHDRLVEGILAMKQEYEAEEAEKRREQERIEAERRAREAEEKAAEERRRAEAAEQLQHIAQVATEAAEIERDKARTALANLEKALADIRLKNRTTFETFAGLGARQIYTLDHAEALEKMKAAVDIEVEPDLKREQLTEPLCELIYFFAESGRRPELARTAAELLLQLDADAAFVPLLRQCTAAGWTTRSQFKPLLEKLPFFQKFQARYYPELVNVPLGADGIFEMGSDLSEWGHQSDEQVHQVKLSAYQISATPVTFYQFALYSEAADRGLASRTPYWGRFGDHPLVSVNWYEAAEYANWLNAQRGLPAAYQIQKEVNSDPDNQVQNDFLKWKVDWDTKVKGFRLPTEAEWELAARAGVGAPKTLFAGSDTLDSVGWYWENSGDKPLSGNWDLNRIYDNNGRTHPVRQKKANGIGVHDMSGNVWEWCWDWYDSGYYDECKARGIEQNPPGSKSSSDGRVVRGGSWDDDPEFCRVALRGRNDPDFRNLNIGFRLVFVP